jgi:UDP-GlcNAc:undecaprenyl-phosphate/decaprenyl-phosphate GlcNAc-1-phosphate transferase
MNIETLGLLGISSLMLTMLLMPVVMRLALAANIIDLPDERKIHTDEIPRLGGFAIAISFAISCILFLQFDLLLIAFLSGLLIITLTGLADDIWHIRPALKFTGEIIASLIFILYGETELKDFGDLIGIGPLETGIFAVPVTVFCMIGVMNALNLSDGLDGLAGGISAIACVFLIYFSLQSGHWLNLALSVSLFACLIGFLYFNSHPAKIFMGDTGSLVLGYILSSICVLSQKLEGDIPVLPISMALILALPIADTLWVMTNRVVRGESPFLADNTHLHHRLLSLNLSHTGAVSVLYACMFICGFLAVSLQSMVEWVQFGTGTGFIIFLYVTVASLQRRGFSFPGQGSNDDVKEYRHDFMHLINATMRKSVPIATWLVPLSLVIPAGFLAVRGCNFGVTPLLMGFIIMVLYPWKSHHERLGWIHGLIYFSTFTLIIFLNSSGSSDISELSWINGYLKIVSCLVLVWVVMKLVFMQHSRIFLTSGFELLMIVIAWFIPNTLASIMGIGDVARQILLVSCLESIVFLLAMKIIIRKEPSRNLLLVGSLIFAYFLIGFGALLK